MINKYAEIQKRAILYKAAQGILRVKLALYGTFVAAAMRANPVASSIISGTTKSDKRGILRRLKDFIWRKKIKAQSPTPQATQTQVTKTPASQTTTQQTTVPQTTTQQTTAPKTNTQQTPTQQTPTQQTPAPQNVLTEDYSPWVLPTTVGIGGLGAGLAGGYYLFNNDN